MQAYQPANGISVDVEDWFQVGAFEDVIGRDSWESLTDRVERNCDAILDLFAELNDKLRLAYLFITHDLTVARAITDDVMVMHDGEIVERGRTADVLSNPRHEATRALVDAAPDLERAIARRLQMA